MTPKIKKLTVLALAASFGNLIKDQIDEALPDITDQERELLLWHCDQITKAGNKAYNKVCGGIKRDKSTLKASAGKILEAIGGSFAVIDMTRMLSFLVMGLDELEHYCKQHREVIREAADATRGFITLWDPNFEDEETHAAAMADYERWIA